MDPNTKFSVGDRLIVVSLSEAMDKYWNAETGEIVFPEEKVEYKLGRDTDFFKNFEGRVATIIRADEVATNHFHYFIDIDPEGWAWCPTMFSDYADEETIEPPDPMSMWYFLGIEENRNPRKGKRK